MDILVDLDPCVYACGFASQKATYQLTLETDQGELSHASFSVKQDDTAGAQMKRFIAELPGDMHVLDKQKLVTPDPISHCLNIVHRTLDAQRASLVDNFGVDSSFHYFLSGSTNYRYRVSKRVPYKGNRLPESRPFHYQAIRDYIIQNWNPIITAGNEADDAISIAAEQAKTQHRDTCVVSIDKDLDQIEGWHYNPDKKVFYQQDRDSALCYFYQQALSGDATDNIPGCYRIGTERAKELITAWTEDYEGIDLDAEKSLWRNIAGIYFASTGKRGCPYTEAEAKSVAIETARLVYIQKASNELWNPPGEPFGKLDEYLRQ